MNEKPVQTSKVKKVNLETDGEKPKKKKEKKEKKEKKRMKKKNSRRMYTTFAWDTYNFPGTKGKDDIQKL